MAHHLLEHRRDSRLLLMDRGAEDRCSSPRDEKHYRDSDASHEGLERPDPSPAEQCLKQHSPHRTSVGRDADRSRLDKSRQSEPAAGPQLTVRRAEVADIASSAAVSVARVAHTSSLMVDQFRVALFRASGRVGGRAQRACVGRDASLTDAVGVAIASREEEHGTRLRPGTVGALEGPASPGRVATLASAFLSCGFRAPRPPSRGGAIRQRPPRQWTRRQRRSGRLGPG